MPEYDIEIMLSAVRLGLWERQWTNALNPFFLQEIVCVARKHMPAYEWKRLIIYSTSMDLTYRLDTYTGDCVPYVVIFIAPETGVLKNIPERFKTHEAPLSEEPFVTALHKLNILLNPDIKLDEKDRLIDNPKESHEK